MQCMPYQRKNMIRIIIKVMLEIQRFSLILFVCSCNEITFFNKLISTWKKEEFFILIKKISTGKGSFLCKQSLMYLLILFFKSKFKIQILSGVSDGIRFDDFGKVLLYYPSDAGHKNTDVRSPSNFVIWYNLLSVSHQATLIQCRPVTIFRG